MLSQGQVLWRVGRRCLVPAAAALLTLLAMLPWLASARPAQDARREDAPQEPGIADSSTPHQAIFEAKAPGKDDRPVGASSRMGTAVGVVVGPDGKPVAGAEIYLKHLWDDPPVFTGALRPWALPPQQFQEMSNWKFRAMRRGRTDATGRFTIRLDPCHPGFPTPYRPQLLVVAKGFGLGYQCLELVEDRWEAVDPPSRQSGGDLRIRLPKTVPIRGRLLAPDGTPVEGVAVKARFVELKNHGLKVCHCNDDFPEYWPRSARTDAQGSFTLRGIPAGSSVYLILYHPRFASDCIVVGTGRSEVPEVERASRYERRRVGPTFSHRLSPARPIEGVVTAADTGKPLPGVTLLLQPYAWFGFPCIFGRTDGQGRYRFDCWREETYSISVCPPPDSGYLRSHTVVRPGPSDAKRARKDFRLARGKIIRGRILDAQTAGPIRGASVRFFPVLHRLLLEAGDGKLFNPALTDQDGRFVVTGTSGPGVLSVETADRSYLRWWNADRVLDWEERYQAHPMTVFSIQVPAEGDLEEEVVIHLRRGRIVVLQAVGPKGERLRWVGARWNGVHSAHGIGEGQPAGFVDGKVTVPGVDPNGRARVFLWYLPQKLAAVFDITPETPDGPIEVRLQPTATLVGRLVKPGGDPVEDSGVHLKAGYDPEVSQFSVYGWGSGGRYQRYFASSTYQETDPDGRFLFDNVVPGVPLGLSYEGHYDPMVSVDPLEPGERRDLGNLAPGGTPHDDLPTLMPLAQRIGLLPSLSAADGDRRPSVFVVPGSPAEKGGIRSGDRITAINGRLVEDAWDIERLWHRLSWDEALGRSLAAGGLRLALLRDGKQVEATLTRDLLPGFFGPKVKPLGDDLFEVTFTYQPKRPAEAVYLAGSFNDWNKSAHKMNGPDQEGRFTTRLKLKKGKYEYKFVLDGQTWQTDPENVLQTGPYRNSVFHVGGGP